MSCAAKYEPNSPLEILHGYGPTPPVFKHYELKLNGHLPYLAAEAEKLSRTTLVELLKEAGFSGKANQWKPDATMPAHVEPLLAEMTFTSQFQAVRGVARGDPRRRRIARALGRPGPWLCEPGPADGVSVAPGDKVFKARALLYAQRMVARDEHSAQARWHRPYALAVIGLHKDALDNLDAAEKEAKAAGASDGRSAGLGAVGAGILPVPDIDRLAAEGRRQPRASWPDCWPFARPNWPTTPRWRRPRPRNSCPGCRNATGFTTCSAARKPGIPRRRTAGGRHGGEGVRQRLYGRLLAMPGLPEGTARSPSSDRRRKGCWTSCWATRSRSRPRRNSTPEGN